MLSASHSENTLRVTGLNRSPSKLPTVMMLVRKIRHLEWRFQGKSHPCINVAVILLTGRLSRYYSITMSKMASMSTHLSRRDVSLLRVHGAYSLPPGYSLEILPPTMAVQSTHQHHDEARTPVEVICPPAIAPSKFWQRFVRSPSHCFSSIEQERTRSACTGTQPSDFVSSHMLSCPSSTSWAICSLQTTPLSTLYAQT